MLHKKCHFTKLIVELKFNRPCLIIDNFMTNKNRVGWGKSVENLVFFENNAHTLNTFPIVKMATAGEFINVSL